MINAPLSHAYPPHPTPTSPQSTPLWPEALQHLHQNILIQSSVLFFFAVSRCPCFSSSLISAFFFFSVVPICGCLFHAIRLICRPGLLLVMDSNDPALWGTRSEAVTFKLPLSNPSLSGVPPYMWHGPDSEQEEDGGMKKSNGRDLVYRSRSGIVDSLESKAKVQ